MQWTEQSLGAELSRRVFDRRALVLVPNCSWPGSECDVLVVTNNLRLIDVEVKLTRADLKADIQKDKWYHHWDYRRDGPNYDPSLRRLREWPKSVWKHYFAMPMAIWKPELLDEVPLASGVLLMTGDRTAVVRVERMAKPNRRATPISAEDALDIARLANLRLWDVYKQVDDLRARLQLAATP